MKILILDDDENRHRLFKKHFTPLHQLTHVITAREAIHYLQHDNFDAIFLDHDLGGHAFVDSNGPEETGYTVALWLRDHPNRCPKNVYIHSMNPIGASNIQSVLPDSVIAPGIWMVKQH